MMKEINLEPVYRDRLLTVQKADDNSLVMIEWSGFCVNLLNTKNYEAFEKMNEILFEQSPDRILVDFQKCEYFFHPDNQEWKNNLMVTKLKYEKARRTAFVIPVNLFVYPAFEASRVVLERDRQNVRYFSKSGQAFNWLLEKGDK